METILLILAAISATADLLATAQVLIEWHDKARSRGIPLDKFKNETVRSGQLPESDLDQQHSCQGYYP
jgi:hypothetical protein